MKHIEHVCVCVCVCVCVPHTHTLNSQNCLCEKHTHINAHGHSNHPMCMPGKNSIPANSFPKHFYSVAITFSFYFKN